MQVKPKYYDGTKLLSLSDINGNKPEIYMVTTNRTGGKTTYFNRLAINRFLDGKIRKFATLYRYKTDIDSTIADRFFKDIKELFFQDKYMTAEKRAGGAYYELFLHDLSDIEEENDGLSCGYAIAINSAEKIKRESHLLTDIDMILFDEFQSETNAYCPDEIQKLMSIHDSVARGNGKQVRYVPVYMMSNPVSIINPYYTEMGISQRLNKDTNFLRGPGWVLEQGFNETASNALASSGFHQAFSGNKYSLYASQAIYLNDNEAFIEKPTGKSTYVATMRYMGKDYAIREYSELGFMYCDDKPDNTFPTKISVTTNDHRINYVMLKRSDFMLSQLRYLFEQGAFRFKDLQCKEVIIKALSY
jgi:hypothetical protein